MMLTLGYSVVESAFLFSKGIELGLRMAGTEEMYKKQAEDLSMLNIVTLLPGGSQFFTDSVYNEVSQSYVPVVYTQIGVSVKTGETVWMSVLKGNLGVFYVIALVAIIIIFVRVIISINRSQIFNWKNVIRLRWLGGLLVLGFLLSNIPQYISILKLKEIFALKGYEVIPSASIDIINLVLGLVALIIAEVFAIGLRMKEEQELTI